MSRFLTKLSGSNTPDVESTLIKLRGKATSTKPNDPLKPHYTLPAILDESGAEPVTVVDSLHIAEYLNEKFPERSVIPKKGKALEYIFEEIFKTTVGAHFPLLPPTCGVQKKEKPYFRSTREQWFGKKLYEFSPEGPVREDHWKDLQGGFGKLAALLDKSGPDADWVAGGSEPTRADFIIASYLFWIRAIIPDEWKSRGIEQWNNGRWGKLLRDTVPWQKVD